MRYFTLLTFGLMLVLGPGCTRKPVQGAAQAMRPAAFPTLRDDLNLDSLRAGLAHQLEYHRKLNPENRIRFGPTQVSRSSYVASLEKLDTFLATSPSQTEIAQKIQTDFQLYEVYGGNHWGEVLVTGYYAPRIQGAPFQRVPFTEPLLERPNDLVEVALTEFDDRFRSLDTMRGRLVRRPDGVQRLIPYYTREEIDKGAIKPPKVIAYVDPLDAFFLQIQGSGTIILPDGKEIEVGYSDQNGHRYEAIGKFLKDRIPMEEMSLARIESALRDMPTDEKNKLLWKNPSFVFFDKRSGGPITQNGTKTVDGRTIATDVRLFPKGTLAFLEFEAPVFENVTDTATKEWTKAGRFVFDQDTGGAIKGPARVDLFVGHGDEAKRIAGVMKNPGRLYYLVPK